MALREVMRHDDKARSGLALGGIGTGCVELRKDGAFHNWSLFNNAPLGTGAELTWESGSLLFFLVRFQERGRDPRMKLLQVPGAHLVAAMESPLYKYPWLTGVERIDYEASFPFARMTFTDPQMPLLVEMEAFSPFIPHDVKNSSLPAAFFQFKVTSLARRPVDVMILASLRSCAGYDVPDKLHATRIDRAGGRRIVQMSCTAMDETHSSWGSQALASLGAGSTHYAGWEHIHPYYEILIRSRTLPNVDDTPGRNITDRRTGKGRAMERLFSTVGLSKRLGRRGAKLENTFLMTWHFPNLHAASDAAVRTKGKPGRRRLEGHYYANFFADAADVARYAIRNRKQLAERTRAFHDDFFDSTAPRYVLDQVNSHLNTFVTSSWLTKEGNFGIEEGLLPFARRGPLATIDVGFYGSVAAGALFGRLDQGMIRAHMRLQNRDTGSICHGIDRDFTTHDAREAVTNRLDLPSQYVLMALRAFFWTGDRAYLAEVWPSVTAAIEYVLRDRDANGDLLPDVAGAMCTYDNFPMYGAASYVASLWLAALAHAAEAARALGETDAAQRYARIRAEATAAFEKKLWNGRYYRLYNDAGGPRGDRDEGCLTDQIVGQWAMHQVGLGPLLAPARVRKALRAILALSWRPDYGLVNCRWPGDGFLHDIDKDCWVDQANTCWSGVELAFASLLMYEGLVADALKIIRKVDDRYRRAGLYFDHQEFGGHYYRAMSAWAIVNAMLGLTIRDGRYELSPRLGGANVKLFAATGEGTVHYLRRRRGPAETITLAVRSGRLRVSQLVLGLLTKRPGRAAVTIAGRRVGGSDCRTELAEGRLTLTFARPRTLRPPADVRVTVTPAPGRAGRERKR